MKRTLTFALCALSLSSCQSTQPQKVEAVSPPSSILAGQAKAGFDMSEALCSGCHAISVGEISPNPESPSFAMIANTEGLTLVTLKDWLRDSHNFPEKMNFEIVDEDVDALSAYIITLREENYTPPGI